MKFESTHQVFGMLAILKVTVRKIFLFILIVWAITACGQIGNKPSQLTRKTDSLRVESQDSLPIKQYWKLMEDTLKFSPTQKNENYTLDTSIKLKVVKGHFTSIDKYECLLQRTFNTRKGGKFDFACIFSFENYSWKFENLFDEDSLMLIDFDKDSILEFFYFEDWAGNGSVIREYRLESLKNNNKNIVFEDVDNQDNRENYCAFSISKVGDTVYRWSKYYFEDTFQNKPLILKSIVRCGIKKGKTKENGDNKLIVRYSTSRKIFIFDGKKYR